MWELLGSLIPTRFFFGRVALVWAGIPLLGFCPTLMGFLFPVSLDPLTALHCIRGSVLAGGDGDTGRLYFFYSFILLGFLCPSFLLVTLLCLDTTLHFLFLLSLSQGQMILFLSFALSLYSFSSFFISCVSQLLVILAQLVLCRFYLFVGELAENAIFWIPGRCCANRNFSRV